MKCADPVLMYSDHDGKRQFRHFSLTKNAYVKLNAIVLDCGKCIVCRKKRAYELACRCVLHASLYKENCFLTLTYDEKLETYHNNFEYKDIQDFKKRLRQHCWRKHAKRIEIFNVHEYGKNGKKHWHLIVFNYDPPDKHKNPGSLYFNSPTLLILWPYGHHSIGDVTEASAMYQASYMKKDFQYDYVTTTKKSHSKHSGLARPYFDAHYKQLLMLGYVPFGGRKLPLPRYFERLAHKHFCHFYDRSVFTDRPERRALYRPFQEGVANREIADLFISYKKQKDLMILDLEKEWNAVMLHSLTTGKDPDFIQSAKNTLYDLKNKFSRGDF